jgi:regulator of sirC expression with transglutaminase-like and TPR domain
MRWRLWGARAGFSPADLSNADKWRNVRQRITRTRIERTAALLETEGGRAALATNLGYARATYEEILNLAPTYAPAHRGLGEVYAALGLPRDAAREYLEYVRQSTDAADRSVINRRLTELKAALTQQETAHDTD